MLRFLLFISVLGSTANQVSAQSLFEVREFTYDKGIHQNGYELPGKLGADWYCALSSITFENGHSKGPAGITVWIHQSTWHVDGIGNGRKANVLCVHSRNRPQNPILTNDFVSLTVPYPMHGLSPVRTRLSFSTNLSVQEVKAIEGYGKDLCREFKNKQLDNTSYFSPEIGLFQFSTDDRYGALAKAGPKPNQVLAKHPDISVIRLTHVKCK